jgi:hypothetical protein
VSTIAAGQIMEYAEKRALQAALGATVALSGTAAFLALSTNAASGSMDNTFLTMAAVTEFTATGYSRQAYTAGTPSSASPSVISNTNTLSYGPLSGTISGTIVWGVLTDASSGTTSNVEVAFLMVPARLPLVGDTVAAAAAAFTCQV